MTRKPYDHNKYAGNQGDVWKHFALLDVLAELDKTLSKEKPFYYFETHAGPGECTITENGEWVRGIGKLLSAPITIAEEYLQFASAPLFQRSLYPGSWCLAARYLSASHRDFSFELFDLSEGANLQAQATIQRNGWKELIRFSRCDGYEAIKQTEKADLILIDPPYTDEPGRPDDWKAAADALTLCARRKKNALLWYPVFGPSNPANLVSLVGHSGVEILWPVQSSNAGHISKGAGLLAIGTAQNVLIASTEKLKLLAHALGGELHFRMPVR